MSKAIRVQDGNLVVDIDSGAANTPAAPLGDTRVTTYAAGVLIEASSGAAAGLEVDTWVAGDKAYIAAYNDETGQYIEWGAHGSTFGAGSLNATQYWTSDLGPMDFLGDYKNVMQFVQTSAANSFVDITDGTTLRAWDDDETNYASLQTVAGTATLALSFSDGDINVEVQDGNLNLGANATYTGTTNLGTGSGAGDVNIGGNGATTTITGATEVVLLTDDVVGFHIRDNGNEVMRIHPREVAGAVTTKYIQYHNDDNQWTVQGDIQFTQDAGQGSLRLGSNNPIRLANASASFVPFLFGAAGTFPTSGLSDGLFMTQTAGEQGVWAVASTVTHNLSNPVPNVVVYRFDTNTTTTSDPGLHDWKMNNATPASVTEIALDDLTLTEDDFGTYWGANLAVGDKIFIKQQDDDANYLSLTISGALIDGTGFWRIPVTVNDSGTVFDTLKPCSIQFNTTATAASSTPSPIVIVGDINTATPPTTEGITAHLNFVDLAQDDIIGQIGYDGENELVIDNLMQGGTMLIRNAGATSGNGGDLAIRTANTTTGGIAGDVTLTAGNSAGTDVGGGIVITAGNSGTGATGDGGDITITAGAAASTNGSGGDITISGGTDTGAGVPGSVFLSNGGVRRFETAQQGSVVVVGDDSSDGTRKRIDFEHQTGNIRATMGLESDNSLNFANFIDGGTISMSARDGGGTTQPILVGDPDALTTLTAETELRFRVNDEVEASRITAATLQTTDASTTEIIGIAVASGEGFGFEIHCMGTEDSTGDTVFERVFGAIRNQGGTTALVGSTITDRTDDAGATTWVIAVAADDTADELTVDVTGEGSHTIDWKVRVHLLNV